MRRLIYLMLFLISFSVSAQIKYVPTDYKIIQDAIDDSKDGDVIIIEEGNYIQQINFKGKAITVASEFYLDGDTSHISKTIIDGIFLPQKDSSSLVYFISGEDSTSVLTGLTLQNGRGTYAIGTKAYCAGGAILMEESGATISHNIIKNNHAFIDITDVSWNGAWGGGLDCWNLPKDRTLIIENNEILNNQIRSKYWQAMGGAIDLCVIYGNARVSKNRIIGNLVESKASGYGGGIAAVGASMDSKIILENNFIANNKTYSENGSTKGGGIACYFSAPIIRNNVIVFNETKYPQNISQNAFGGGIAVFWYLSMWKSDWPVCEDPYSLNITIENNTIAYNNDKLEGGGVALRSVGARLKNNIIGCNFGTNNKQIKIEFPDAPESRDRRVFVQYSNVEGGFEGEGNINEFPEFKDDETWYLKKDHSPCIDAGNYENKYNDVEDPNVSGQARFPALGKLRNDIGAFGGPHSKWSDELLTDIKNVEFTIPAYLSLSQNYPNPFNPSTTIKYQIPQINVGTENFPSLQLKIYDILGREIATLVNEKQKPGNYEVKWDGLSEFGGQVPSGIYFYKLITENYSLTKKMIFLK